jgi:hypothetical protein
MFDQYLVYTDGTFEEADPETGNTIGYGDWLDINDLLASGQLDTPLAVKWTLAGFSLPASATA